jgi:hypothetical protein
MTGADKVHDSEPARSADAKVRCRSILVLAILMLAAFAGPRALAAVAPIGTVFSGYLPFAGKQIPLPQGEWVLVGDGYQILPGEEGSPGDAIEDVVLFQRAKDTVSAFIIAHRNLVSRDEGWGVAADCDRDDILAKVGWDEADGHGFCGFVNHVQTAVTEDSAESWKQATAYARQWRLRLPATWLMAGYRLSDNSDVVDVRYHFDPAMAGFPPTASVKTWSDSPWAKTRIDGGQMPESWTTYGWSWVSWARGSGSPPPTPRQRAADSLAQWLDDMRHPVKLGFSNQARAAPAMTMPWAAAASAPPPQLVLRLARLDELKARHVLTNEQYHLQRAIIETESGHVASGRWTAAGLTNVKTVTDELSTIVLSFSADAIYTQSLATAAQLVTANLGLDLMDYWLLEHAWNKFGPRAGTLEAVPQVGFASAGIDGPAAAAEAAARPTVTPAKPADVPSASQ